MRRWNRTVHVQFQFHGVDELEGEEEVKMPRHGITYFRHRHAKVHVLSSNPALCNYPGKHRSPPLHLLWRIKDVSSRIKAESLRGYPGLYALCSQDGAKNDQESDEARKEEGAEEGTG